MARAQDLGELGLWQVLIQRCGGGEVSSRPGQSCRPRPEQPYRLLRGTFPEAKALMAGGCRRGWFLNELDNLLRLRNRLGSSWTAVDAMAGGKIQYHNVFEYIDLWRIVETQERAYAARWGWIRCRWAKCWAI